jgi:hypothetical protein
MTPIDGEAAEADAVADDLREQLAAVTAERDEAQREFEAARDHAYSLIDQREALKTENARLRAALMESARRIIGWRRQHSGEECAVGNLAWKLLGEVVEPAIAARAGVKLEQLDRGSRQDVCRCRCCMQQQWRLRRP